MSIVQEITIDAATFELRNTEGKALSGRDRRSERILESRIRDESRVHAEKNIEVVIG